MDPEIEEVVAPTAEQEAAEFDGGFGDDVAIVAAPADEQKMAQIPEDEYRKLLDSVAKIEGIEGALEKQFGTAFGKIGGIERVLDQLKESAPAGGKIELSKEVVADLAAEFPEMAELQYKTLQKLVDVLNTTRTVTPAPQEAAQPSAPVIDEEAIERRVRRAITEETLNEFDEKWKETIGLPDDKGVIPDTPFRQWLVKQPKEYQTRVRSTYSATVLTDALTKFRAAQTKAQGRREVLDAAVEVTGSGGQAPNAGSTDNDEFDAGFKS
jgi:hypothetical protein